MLSKKARILVRLEQELSEKIRAHAKAETRSINGMINHAVKTYIRWREDQ